MKNIKCNVVMLTTENPSEIALDIKNKWLYKGHKLSYNHQHLYITSSDEIKEGDYIYNIDTQSVLTTPQKSDFELKVINSKDHIKKIIASTNTELYKEKIDKIDLNFIEEYITEYNKGNIIKEVNVEYDSILQFENNSGMFNKQLPNVDKPKLHSDGTIIIHRLQEIFTKEDMEKSYNAGFKDKFDFETWLNKNY